MMVNENVTEGQVHIGVLQGSDGPEKGNGRSNPGTAAWNKPAIEMETDYVGTVHIYQNITFNSTYGWSANDCGWLGCWHELLDSNDNERLPEISAEDVFGHN
jgi:hypothetical protein